MREKVIALLTALLVRCRYHEARLQGQIDAAMREVRRRNAALPDEWGTVRTAFGQSTNLVDVILSIVITGVVAYVGLQVGSDTQDSADFNTSQDDGNQTAFENASQEITGGFETSFGLLDVVFISLMLSVIVTALIGIRRR